MRLFEYKNKKYKVDAQGFLLDPNDWDEGFAEGISAEAQIQGSLTAEHWKVIYFIRNAYQKFGVCPLVYDICNKNGISLSDLQGLFPTGYHRGAFKLAGMTCRGGLVLHPARTGDTSGMPAQRKVYRVDAQGFLINPPEWDEEFAVNKAAEMKMPNNLTAHHWQVIYYMRERFEMTGRVPTVYDTCRDNRLDIESLERLFPDGYQRGAVKLAGLWLCEE